MKKEYAQKYFLNDLADILCEYDYSNGTQENINNIENAFNEGIRSVAAQLVKSGDFVPDEIGRLKKNNRIFYKSERFCDAKKTLSVILEKYWDKIADAFSKKLSIYPENKLHVVLIAGCIVVYVENGASYNGCSGGEDYLKGIFDALIIKGVNLGRGNGYLSDGVADGMKIVDE